MSWRTLGVLLAAVAAATAVLATFLPYSWVGSDLGPTRFGFTTNGWGTLSEPAALSGIGPDAQTGVPVVIAAVLLVVGAALVFLPAHQRQAARYTAVAATGLLIGSAWTTFTVISADLSPVFRAERASISYSYGAGLWLLVVACAVAVMATVFLHARPPAPVADPGGAIVHRVDDGTHYRPDDSADDGAEGGVDTDTDTPPFGISVPVLPEGYLDRAVRPGTAPDTPTTGFGSGVGSHPNSATDFGSGPATDFNSDSGSGSAGRTS